MAQTLLQTVQTYNASLEAMAALGAMLKLRREGLKPHPAVAARLESVIAAIDPALLETATPEDEDAALAFIRSFFRQAADLLENPARDPGWVYDDPLILQSQGRASRIVVRSIAAAAAEDPDLKRVVEGEGRLLDIGTGVGWLAIEAARTWPGMRVTGIDIYEPALKLARENVQASGLGDRVELRTQSVEAIEEPEGYSLIWFPGPFIPYPLVRPSIERIMGALMPGGFIVFGYFGAQTPLAEALTDLRVVRSGGHPWTAPAITDLLAEAGFVSIRVVAPKSLAVLVVGRKPR